MKTSDDLQSMQTTGSAGVMDQAKETVTQATGQAKQLATEATDRAKGTLREQLDQRSTELGRRIKQNADQVTQMTGNLRESGSEREAQMIETVGQKVAQLGDYLEQSDADKLLADAQEFARKQPWAIAAAALGLGLMGSRFVKAASYTGSDGSSNGTSDMPMPAGAMQPTAETEWE